MATDRVTDMATDMATDVPAGWLYSVVIPCRNGAATLERQLLALAAQDYPGPYEVVVADNGSTDDSVALVRRLQARVPGLRSIDASAVPGINHARNRGAQEAAGDFLLFCDCDDEVAPDWLRTMHEARLRGADMVGGELLDAVSGTPIGLSPVSPLYGGFGFLLWPGGANCGVSRAVYERVGPFDEQLGGGCDETDFFWRAQLLGVQLTAVPGARVHYSTRSGLRQTWQQAVAYGRGDVRLYAKYAHLGMPAERGLRTTARLARKALRLAAAPNGRQQRVAVVKQAGLLSGRLVQSHRLRRLYV